MTPQQAEQLRTITEAVTVAHQLLAQARTASATNDMRIVLSRHTRTTIADALQSTTLAVQGLTPQEQKQEVEA